MSTQDTGLAALAAACGIGTVVMVSIKEFKIDKVFAAVLMASLLGLVFFALVNLIGPQCPDLKKCVTRPFGRSASW